MQKKRLGATGLAVPKQGGWSNVDHPSTTSYLIGKANGIPRGRETLKEHNHTAFAPQMVLNAGERDCFIQTFKSLKNLVFCPTI